ncbi:GGDEF domain-containing protein [Xylophilus sp. GOD-11R]|uniref:GGDEF domain-containing protein n=1 Tax=Xylophilus sp. GOD-11R TaxID=3089814 RepID=UPI00298C757D|nr:GGDEF domain-containing protein [Xylophilus sp. GOD-11R]WPB59441.1 GGDEF domain-containing protein [Xylophilus sp. GOD-11R]
MTPNNPSPILQHLVEITGHRDHTRLEYSVISALRHLVGMRQVRKLEFFLVKDVTYVRPCLLLVDGEMVAPDAVPVPDSACPPLASHTELMQGLEQRSSSIQYTYADGSYRLWLPVRLDDRVVSCLEISNDSAYSAQTLDVINGIVEVYRNYQSLLDYSERDALTGLFNRKTFDEQFSRHTRDATSTTRPEDDVESHWLAVVDIDHFKQVNDRFGHVYGDEVLILVANLLKSSFRSQDRIFRFGGEEFVVLLRQATLEQARLIFNRFRTNIEQFAFPQVGRVTVSVGFTIVGYGAPVEIMGHADQALYHAKENGRNQVCYYEELMKGGQLQAADVAHDDVELF